eukprot:scaffold130484_cov19-Tisochrysis_lutea.AAC.3
MARVRAFVHQHQITHRHPYAPTTLYAAARMRALTGPLSKYGTSTPRTRSKHAADTAGSTHAVASLSNSSSTPSSARHHQYQLRSPALPLATLPFSFARP